MSAKELLKGLGDNLNIHSDEFVNENFDTKAFTSAIIKTNSLSEHLQNLSQSINLLDKEIKDQVSLHHEDLLHQAINIETLEEMLDMVQTRISSLKSTSERLRTKISTPYNELSLRILQLSRLQAACDNLRRIKGILHHSAKLRVHMQSGIKDITKSAQCLNELDILLRNFDYSGIEIIEKDVHYAHKSRHEIEEQADHILEKSMQNSDQTQIGVSLQVFYSLGILTEKLANALKVNEKKFQKLASDLLDITNLTLTSTSSSSAHLPGRVNMPAAGSLTQLRAQLWSNIEKLMDNLYDSCVQIVQLQQILEKKKDLISNLLYVEELEVNKLPSTKVFLLNQTSNDLSQVVQHDSILLELDSKKSVEFLYEQWSNLIMLLNSSIANACNKSTHISQTFQNEYPKLLKLQNDVWSRLIQLYPFIERYRFKSQSNKNSISYLNAYELLRKCFLDLENFYLNKSLSFLYDPINLLFSQNSQQLSKNDFETYVKGIQSQLQTLQHDAFSKTIRNSSSFSDKVIGNIAKSVEMYSNKCEQILNRLNAELQLPLNNSTLFLNISASTNLTLARNLDYLNLANDLFEQISKLFDNEKVNRTNLDKLSKALKSLMKLQENTLEPFVQAANTSISLIMLKIHKEDFSSHSASSYVKELQQLLQRVCVDFLLQYNNKQILNSFLTQLGVNLVDLFIRNCSFLRPISDTGKQRLLSDSQQIEILIQNNLTSRLSDLGVFYKHLKAFRSLLQTSSPLDPKEPSELGTEVAAESHFKDVLEESLPYHVLLHFLFSYAPEELKSPFQSLNWSVARYSEWMDTHKSEKERLLVIKTCLETYVNLIKQKKEKSFAPIYPLMFRLLEKGLHTITQVPV